MAEELERGTLLRTISANDGRSVRRISSNIAPFTNGMITNHKNVDSFDDASLSSIDPGSDSCGR